LVELDRIFSSRLSKILKELVEVDRIFLDRPSKVLKYLVELDRIFLDRLSKILNKWLIWVNQRSNVLHTLS